MTVVGFKPMSKIQEIVIGLVAPIGTDLDLISTKIEQCVKSYQHTFKEIKISEDFINFNNLTDKYFPENNSFENYNEFQKMFIKMQAGSEIREKSKYNGILSRLAIDKIANFREKLLHDNEDSKKIIVYLIRQLKRKEEIDVLRSVYSDSFIQLSVQDSEENIFKSLKHRLSKNHSLSVSKEIGGKYSTNNNCFNSIILEEQVHTLIRKDFEESDPFYKKKKCGQNISSCFDKANYFMHCGLPNFSISDQVKRFCELLFSNPFIQPTYDESFMFHAFGQASRSMDISRQIGAVIVNKNNEIISVGCNDVNGLGHPLSQESKDDIKSFDYSKGENFNTKQREIMADKTLSLLKDKIGKISTLDSDELKDSLVKTFNIIGYHRTLCGEMSAIMDAARRGVSIRNATIYSTTFPCHLCMKHIIASGIDKVIFIEPYPKSKTEDMFDDFVNQSVDCKCNDKVNIVPYVGVSPRSYLFAYTATSRKNKTIHNFNYEIPRHIKYKYSFFYQIQEQSIISHLNEIKLEQGYEKMTSSQWSKELGDYTKRD